MIRPLFAATLALGMLAASPTLAAPCKDAKGTVVVDEPDADADLDAKLAAYARGETRRGRRGAQ